MICIECIALVFGLMCVNRCQTHVSGPVPVISSEDETAIKKIVHYDAGRDELVGFCGKSVQSHHTCDPYLKLTVGSDYNALVQAFKVISKYQFSTSC